jgi:hypothetical protein
MTHTQFTDNDSLLMTHLKGEMELKSSETAPTKDDLIGFWELVSLQVESMNKNLENIHNKKNNNWKEAEKEKTPVGKKKKTTPKSVQSQRYSNRHYYFNDYY